jgi:hypothetical protein
MSYQKPICTVEDFTYTQIAYQRKYNDCISPGHFYQYVDEYGDKYTPTKYISKDRFKRIIVRLARCESRFKRFAFNSSTKARGLFQHIGRFWNQDLLKVDNGNLGKHIKKNNITNVNRYYFNVKYSTEMGCKSLARCIEIKKGDIVEALKFYSGFLKFPKYIKTEAERKEFIRKGNEYVNFVMDIE